MVAGKYDLLIEEGVPFSKSFIYVNSSGDGYNLDSWNAVSQGRLNINSTGTLFNWSTYSGTMVCTGSVIQFTVNGSQTSGLNFSTGIYDIRLFESGTNLPRRFLEGNVFYSRSVTQ